LGRLREVRIRWLIIVVHGLLVLFVLAARASGGGSFLALAGRSGGGLTLLRTSLSPNNPFARLWRVGRASSG
jgi:hypothetical protein